MRFKLVERALFEDIESMKKYFPNIPDEQFQSLIELDPTYTPGSKNAGTYGRWILTLANKGKLDNIGHVKDLLTRFNDNAKYLKNKDIMRYKTMDEVENMLNDEDSYKEQSHRQEVRDRQKARKNADLGNEAKKVYEDSTWEVWVPLTYAASCKLGQGASWCTASTESDYYYNHYKNNYGGDYYININKQDPEEKYQFHFESGQFMDVDDAAIDLSDFLSKNRGLKEFYSGTMYNIYVKKWDISEDGKASVNGSVLAEALSNRDIDESLLNAYFSGELYDYFSGYGFYADMQTLEYNIDEVDERNKSKLEEITGLSVADKDFVFDVRQDYSDIYDILISACDVALEEGASEEFYKDFTRSLYSNSRPFIIDWEIIGGSKVNVAVNMKYLQQNIIDIVSIVASEDVDTDDFSYIVAYYIGVDFYFSEPRYGWTGFSAEAFNNVLFDELPEA